MFGGQWEIECVKDYSDGIHALFYAGNTYRVKDKLIGDDMTLDSGDWQVLDERRSLVNLSQRDRAEYFEPLKSGS